MIPVMTYIDTRAPGYSADTRVSPMILQAEDETGTAFGILRNAAIALLVLHWLAMDDRAGGSGGSLSNSVGGTIKREREGSLEREYMIDFSLTKQFPDLSQTRWGMELIELRKKCILTPYNRFVTNA
jgi:hypothetical protein